MIYAGFSLFVVAFIYFNVLGLFKNYKNLPASQYKDTLWKFKKLEIVEKAVQSGILVLMILSMKFFEDSIATISLIGMAVMLVIEHFFGKYMRGAFVCPACGMPVWNGNFVVILQARKYCPHCRNPFVEEPEAVLETAQQTADEEHDDAEE